MLEFYDVFVSYAQHADGPTVDRLVDALQQKGLRVWYDKCTIDTFETITGRIQHGLARAKALLAFYSTTYPTRTACQWELTAAFLAAVQIGDPAKRILVVNPAKSTEHIHPVELRDALCCSLPQDADAGVLASAAEKVLRQVAALENALGDIRPMTAPPSYGFRPLGSNRFVGRVTTLWQLHSALFAGDLATITGHRGPGHAQVRGMGGVGKSLLAEEYALRFQAAYPRGVFFLNGMNVAAQDRRGQDAQEASRIGQFADFAVALGLRDDTTRKDPGQVTAWLTRRLAATSSDRDEPEPYLWIVDDLPGDLPEEDRRRWLAPSGNGKTLITTRSRKQGATGAVIDLDVLLPDEAIQLLVARLPQGATYDRAAARDIVAALGHLPLAVDVAGSALEALGGANALHDFFARIRSPGPDVLEAIVVELEPDLPNGHERSVARTLWSSIERLDEASRDFLRLAAALASEAIPEDLVELVFRILGEAGALGAKAIVARVRAASLAEQAALAEGRMIDSSAPPNPKGYSVHALVARTMRLTDTDANRADRIRTVAMEALAELLPAVEDIREHGRLRAHIAHARHLSRVLDGPTSMTIAAYVARYEYARGSYEPARRLEEDVLEARRRLLGPEHPATLWSMGNLAGTLSALGDYEGTRKLEEAVLEARRRLVGPEHAATLLAMNNLAVTLSKQGDYEGARKLEEAVLEAHRRVRVPEHPATLVAMNNLALTLTSQGDYEGARTLQEVVLEAHRRVRGPEHPAAWMAMGNLAVTLRAQGDYEGARELDEAALEACQRVLGPEHPATLVATNNLAQTLTAQGDYDGARTLQEVVLEADRRKRGPEHPDTWVAMGNLAQTLGAQGDHEGARKLEEAVLEAHRRVRGPEHPATLLAMNNLALTLTSQGDYERARTLQEVVLEAHRRVLGPEHPATLSAMNNLAGTLRAQGDNEGARTLQEVVLEAHRRVLGPEHPATLSAMNNLAGTLSEQGDYEGARTLQDAVLEARRRVLGAEHPATLVAMGNLAVTLSERGNYEGARTLQDAALEACRRVLGPEHPATLSAMGNLAATLSAQRDYEAARTLGEAVLEARRRVLGPEHPDTLLSMGNLAGTLSAQGDYEGACKLEELVLETRRRVLGPEHPHTLLAMKNLARTQQALRFTNLPP